jgi:hypothetical protein
LRSGRGGLADLLDRALDRGVYLGADLVVTVAGVPLLGLSLRALLGAVDTLVEYGVFGTADALLQPERERGPAATPDAAGVPAAQRRSARGEGSAWEPGAARASGGSGRPRT